jgi:hypothetical protein
MKLPWYRVREVVQFEGRRMRIAGCSKCGMPYLESMRCTVCREIKASRACRTNARRQAAVPSTDSSGLGTAGP